MAQTRNFNSLKDLPRKKESRKDKTDSGDMVLLEGMNFSEARIDRDRALIENVVFLGAESLNKRRYHKAMEKPDTIQKYDGIKMYFNHPADPADGRDVLSLWGRTVNPRIRAGEQKIRGDVKVINHHNDVFNLVEGASDLIGFSHVAQCEWSKAKDGWVEIEDISRVLSVDLVDETGTTKGIFERLEAGMEEHDMTIETVKELREKYPELASELAAEAREAALAEQDDKKTAAEMERLKTENALLKEKIENREKAEESASLLESALEESKLPDAVKEKIRERADGKVFDEEAVKAEIAFYEEIVDAIPQKKAARGINIPTTKADSGDDLAEGRKVMGDYIASMFGAAPAKKTEKEDE